MRKSNYIIYDCETGGLDFNKNPITQFACLILDSITLKEIARWETYVRPYNDLIIEKEALERTLVDIKDINNGLQLKNFVNAFKMLLSKYNTVKNKPEIGRLIPVGHNITFDNGFLIYAFEQLDLNYFDFVFPNFIDTYSLGKMTFCLEGNEKLNLTACCEFAGLDLKNAHDAMNDVVATSELFKFYVNKLRQKNNVKDANNNKRKQGTEFFEFCRKSKD
jgi:DNA polymerase III alpha subunit (gram-positive type)